MNAATLVVGYRVDIPEHMDAEGRGILHPASSEVLRVSDGWTLEMADHFALFNGGKVTAKVVKRS